MDFILIYKYSFFDKHFKVKEIEIIVDQHILVEGYRNFMICGPLFCLLHWSPTISSLQLWIKTKVEVKGGWKVIVWINTSCEAQYIQIVEIFTLSWNIPTIWSSFQLSKLFTLVH